MTSEELNQLKTRRAAITAEISQLNQSTAGGKPSYTIDGQSVDHVGYRKSLYDELDRINQAISALSGSIELTSRGVT